MNIVFNNHHMHQYVMAPTSAFLFNAYHCHSGCVFLFNVHHGWGGSEFTVCFVVPFDEDERDRSVWFLDHDYLENMSAMFKKVNCKYSGPSHIRTPWDQG